VSATLPLDQVGRDRIAQDLGRTLFVEAGAGSGKTTALVGRVVALVAQGAAELRAIAAITFTEKAATELRDRVRIELQRRAADPEAPPEVAARCAAALEQVDSAAIGTLHAFAQRILREHPVEAALPPRVEVLDEVSSGVAFDRRFAHVLDQLLDDPDLARTLLLLHAAGVHPRRLRSLAQAFDDAWDLVEERVPADAPEPPALGPALAALEGPLAELVACCEDCVDESDGLLARVVAFRAFLEELLEADELDAMELLTSHRPSHKVSRTGNKNHWRCTVDDVRAQVVALGEALDEARQPVLQACAHRLGAAMRRHTLEAAHARRAAGELEFHDLLVLARKVLRDPTHGPDVRRALHQRYERLLLDEFQDTDPIQIELAVRIAAADPAQADAPSWRDVEVGDGRLFVVGDPKQSIYRFRRADISTFLEAQERFGAGGHQLVELTANFRTVEPVITWINDTFGELLGEPAEQPVDVPSQPAYVALDAERPAPPNGPAVATLGRQEHPSGSPADVLRAAEAADVANAVTVALAEAWPVRDGDGWRPPTLGDITILVPARTSLPFLERALEEARIPFRAESSSLVYASRAVRDLLLVLRAADDPTDHLRIVAALRTPLLACGDDDLFRFKVHDGGAWDYTASALGADEDEDGELGPVVAGLRFLRELHRARHWSSPAELLDHIARERRALELGFAEERPRDVWRRLRFVIDQARAWSEATGGSLRAYLHWVDQQTLEGARVTESVLPETDDDAVRIMTIHAAKGLEFPITIVSGMSTKPQARPNPVEVVFPRHRDTVGYKLGKDVVTEEFEAWKPIDEQMGYDERIRLLYVACTRACDHLVVSLHRAARRDAPAAASRTNAELLVAGMRAELAAWRDLSGHAEPLAPNPAARPTPPPPFTAWAEERTQALERAGRPGTVSATALTEEGERDPAAEVAVEQRTLFDPPAELAPPPDGALVESDPGLQKRPRDLDLPPWLKGRYGTAVGSAVHGVLQVIDLATGNDLDALVAAQCQAEAVPEREDDVRQLVAAALGSPSVREAAASTHWREVYACTPIGDRLLEGYLDLLYRGPEGLVVVDHKTAATDDPGVLDHRVEGYRLQGAAYALAIGRATGEPVVRVTFTFLTPSGAVERHLPDLPASVTEVERLVAAGAELVVP
jgi:ATP-dependent helicase/nuclease subunit A